MCLIRVSPALRAVLLERVPTDEHSRKAWATSSGLLAHQMLAGRLDVTMIGSRPRLRYPGGQGAPSKGPRARPARLTRSRARDAYYAYAPRGRWARLGRSACSRSWRAS